MEPVRRIVGRALPLARADVDTDQIIPSHWLKRLERTGYGPGLFEAWRKDPAFVLNDPRYLGAVVLTTLLLTVGGIYSVRRMPSGVYPEVTFPRIAVVAKKEIEVSFNPFQKPPTLPESESKTPLLDEILTDSDSQIKLGLAHDKALDLLTRSVDALASKLDDVKADKLPSTILAASKVVDAIRRERSESVKNNRDRDVHYHFYTPQQKKIADFEVIDVGGAVEAMTS